MAKKIIELKNFYDSCEIAENQLNSKILYSKAKSGKIIAWQGHLLCSDTDGTDIGAFKRNPISFECGGHGVFYTSYRSGDGKLTISAPTVITAGTNKGRKNETTPFQQAIGKLMTKFNDKLKEGAVTDRAEILEEISFETIVRRNIEHPNRINVMALHNVKDHWPKVKYPCFMQPKLDGIHMIANCHNGLDLFSRGMSKKISQNHIRDALAFLCEPQWRGVYVTGEMWAPKIIRQDIASIVGQEQDENITTRLALYVFDVFSVDKALPFTDRYKLAIAVVRRANSQYIKLVKARTANSREEIEIFYKEQLNAGMEGIVIRAPDSLYEFGIQKEIRSYGVMKYKPRQDSEFLIVDFKAGVGKFKNSIIFIAETAKGDRFSVTPAWPQEAREKALREGASYIGRYATIEYDTLSDKGVPVQPVLKAFI